MVYRGLKDIHTFKILLNMFCFVKYVCKMVCLCLYIISHITCFHSFGKHVLRILQGSSNL